MGIEKNSRLLNLYIPLFLVLVGFFWKLYYIEFRDISNDEPFTIFHAQMGIKEIIGLSTSSEPTPPLYMLLLHFWIKIFGISPFSVRFMPLLFNAFTVWFIYLTGKRFVSFWAGMAGSGLFLFSNYHFIYGLETRTYSLVALATAASLYFFLRYTENQKDRKALAGLIISNLLLVYSHYFGWFVIFSQVISSFFYLRSLKAFFRFMLPPLATLVGFTPMIPIIIKQFLSKSERGTWLNPPSPDAYLNELYYFLNTKTVFIMILVVFGLGVVFTLIKVFRRQWKGLNISVMVFLQWWIIPYSIMFFASSKVPMFNNRYLIFNSIGLYLFIGAFINFLYQKNKYFEPLAGLVVLIYMFVYIRILPADLGYREVRKSVEMVKSADTGDRIVMLYPYWSSYQFYYYYNREIFTDLRNYDELMRKDDVYRLWGLNNAKQTIEAHPGKRVIYIQDGPYHDPQSGIFSFLDSAYVKRDSVFFPQTIRVNIYDPKAE